MKHGIISTESSQVQSQTDGNVALNRRSFIKGKERIVDCCFVALLAFLFGGGGFWVFFGFWFCTFLHVCICKRVQFRY